MKTINYQLSKEIYLIKKLFLVTMKVAKHLINSHNNTLIKIDNLSDINISKLLFS